MDVRAGIVSLVIWLALVGGVRGEMPASIRASTEEYLRQVAARLQVQTLGGFQLWTDERIHGGWRIQRHSLFTDDCRLLDPEDLERISGSYDDCHAELERHLAAGDIPPLDERVVFVLHGLTGWRGQMTPLVEALRRETKLEPLTFGYASTRADLDTHAGQLRRVVESLPPTVTEIHFVGYSLGNLVIRRLLHDWQDPRLGRVVMLAPPNHGARRAEPLERQPVSRWIIGPAAVQLAVEWDSIAERLAVPSDFAVIAGGCGNDEGYSPRVPGDDDIVLGVKTTRLAGARDFLLVNAPHYRVHRLPATHAATARFLEQGYLVDPERRQPIVDDGGRD